MLSEEQPGWDIKDHQLYTLEGVKDVYLDFETNGLRWRDGDRPGGFGLHTEKGSIYCAFGHEGGGNTTDNDTALRWCREQLRNKHIVNLNTRFDIHMAYAWGVDLEAQGCTVSDVSHYAALLDDHRKRFSLDILSQDFLGREKEGKELDASSMMMYHASQVAPRAIGDVLAVRDLKKKMWPLLDRDNLQGVRQLEDDIIFVVCEMERNAAPLDVELLEAYCTRSLQEYERCLYNVARDLGFPVLPKNKDWVRVFEKLGIEITHHTPTGAPSFTDDVISAHKHPVVVGLRRAGKLSSLRTKFLVAYKKVITGDGRLCYNLHQLRIDDKGTVRGRFSSSAKNIQQVMSPATQKEDFGDDYVVRRLFVPGPECQKSPEGQFLSADARQIEYRLFAHYAANPKVIAAYKKDAHISFHEFVWEMVKTVKADIEYKPLKNLNFAKLYGAGKDKVAEMLDMKRGESDAFVRKYDQMFPEIGQQSRHYTKLAGTQGYVQTILGRRARFPGRHKSKAYAALNAAIQGGAADINKLCLIAVHKERKKTGFVLRFTVHDEMNGDSPDYACKRMVQKILSGQQIKLHIPITWKVECGENWAQTIAMKNMEPQFIPGVRDATRPGNGMRKVGEYTPDEI